LSKILVIGTGPLYSPEIKVFCGQSLRTWHVAKTLRDAGHAVDLIVMQTDGHAPDGEVAGQIAHARYEGLNYGIIHTWEPDAVLGVLQQAHDSSDYDCIVAVNVNAAAIAARLRTHLPMWCDLMGHMMGEAQAKCGVERSNELLLHFWSRQRRALRRADKVSVSAHKQMYAVLGELGVLGRLGFENAAHPFCAVVPIAADPMFLDLDLPVATKRFRGDLFPEESFTVLWTGGYNTWTDVETLAAALSLAMEQVPRMRFVSTGGAIPGHNESTYPQFQDLMRRSGYIDRCHFLGWVEGEEIPPLYAECDLGLNIDGLNYETLLGGRNRLVNMMAAGLPVLTTLGTELSEIICDNRLGYTVHIGKVQEFADALIRASKISPERRQLGQRGRSYVKEHFSPEAVMRPLLKWAAAPFMAPDNEAKLRRAGENVRALGEIASNPLEEEALALENGLLYENEHLRREVERLQSELLQLRGSRFYKVRRTVQQFKRAVAPVKKAPSAEQTPGAISNDSGAMQRSNDLAVSPGQPGETEETS